MQHTETGSYRDVQSLQVICASRLRVASGANLGDALGFADELQAEDVYQLSPGTSLSPLRVDISATPPYRITSDSETGQAGADLHPDSCLTFMSRDGSTTDVLVLVETDAQGNVAQIHALPFAPMQARTDYILIRIDRDGALQKLAQLACASFTHGTRITLSNGLQKPVQDLRPGDRILTRDDGPQDLRWIGHHTARATGLVAPIRIAQGALNNAGDLVVSPDHRLFVYQRSDALGAGRAELLVRARHLLNGTSITQLTGGHVDYFQMLFDRHQIIYAEGIAAESTRLDSANQRLIDDTAGLDLQSLLPRHSRDSLGSLEVTKTLLQRPDAADALRRASSR